MNEESTVFVKNAWYGAGWDHEAPRRKMLRRALPDIPDMLCRKQDGAP